MRAHDPQPDSSRPLLLRRTALTCYTILKFAIIGVSSMRRRELLTLLGGNGLSRRAQIASRPDEFDTFTLHRLSQSQPAS